MRRSTDRLRSILRAWWLWIAIGAWALRAGYWPFAILAAALAYIFYQTSPRTHPVAYALRPRVEPASSEFRTTMAGVTGSPWEPGNLVTIYNNGDEFYPAMLDAIESAQRSVTMEQFIFWAGEIGTRFAEALAAKSREGVQVKLLLDAIGSSTLGPEIFRILEEGGCQLAWFQPVRWYSPNRVNKRDHRKSVIVDGRIAFTGGAGIADQWLGTAANPTEWRDIQIRVEGGAVLEQQSGFAQNWLRTTGEIISGPAFFPEPIRAGGVEVQTVLSSPVGGAGAAGTMHVIALQCARRELLIANSYFIPDERIVQMLELLHGRGTRVRILVAGCCNDTWWARQNSVRLYGRLLEAGAEIYEFEPTMLHQKIMIVDGEWATVGTSNFDNRSFALNEETNVCFHDPQLIAELRAGFEADLLRSHRITFDDWRRRGFWQRAQEQFAALIEDQV